MQKHISYLILIFLIFQLSSCKTREHLVYFQQEGAGNNGGVIQGNYTPTLKTDDLLSILVTGDDPEAVIPFNLPAGLTPQNINSGYTMGNPAMNGYLIDINGEIAMPVIGRLKVAGLNRMEAIELIEKKLKEYVTNPVVQIQIQNYKVTVLGDVKSPGTYKIPNERITILEAIGLAGDLNLTGTRKNVLVIRDDNGKKMEYRIDLTSKDLFFSPVYYLTQNDVVYIEPNKTARSESTLWRTTGPIFISLTSIIITTVSLILR